jgi:sporulation protein YlmC with PRC-barrel domain
MEDLIMQNSTTGSTTGGKHLISSREVEGTTVYNADGKKIGSIDHLVIERVSGQVTYAVVDFGGFLGRLKSHYRLPWPTLKYDAKLEGYRTDVTKEQLKCAPGFDEDSYSDRDWETQTHRNYGVEPYWASPSIR